MDEIDEGGGANRYDISEDEVSIKSPSYEDLSKLHGGMDTTPAGDRVTLPITSGASKTVLALHPVIPQAANAPHSQANGSSDTCSTATPRLKAYPPGSKGPFLVFFRPKGKPLNKIQIQKDLAKSFRDIVEVSSPSRNKLRVTVSDREQANRIAACELFLREYHVYLPSLEVECTGVVTEAFMTCADIRSGTGGFKNRAVPPVQIVDVKQMNFVSSDGTKSPSNSFRVTFSGSALPDVLVIGLLRLPVRLYKPTVMHCEKCQQLGHTSPYCCNKPRCGKCGEQHVEGPCPGEPKCTCCGQAPHELVACPKFIEREKHTIRSLQQRSKRSYAEILKKIAPAAEPLAQPSNNNNLFTSLPDDDQGSGSEDVEEYTVINTGTKRKRAIAKRLKQRQQAPQNIPVQQVLHPSLEKSRRDGNPTKVLPPGFKFSAGDFPILPGTSKTPDFPVFRSENQQTCQQESRQEHVDASGKMTLSGLVDIIFETLEVSPVIRNLINMALSFVKPLLKRLASKWPILDSFISFDG